MDAEKKPEDSEDGTANKDAQHSRAASSQDVGCGPVPEVAASSAENSTSKRAFPEPSPSVAVEDGREHASKRMKPGEPEPCRSREQGVHGLLAAGIPPGEMMKTSLLSECADGDARPPTACSPSCSSSTADTVSLKTDTEKSAQEMVSLDPDTESSFSTEEAVSVGCTVGNVDAASKCSMREHSFSSLSDLEKQAQCHVPPSKEPPHCPCSHGAESSAVLQTHTTQTHGCRTVFSCDLCGFQCVEENLLNAHCLGKTHLRRQNLAARGGFVQILTKQSFPKKPCTIGTKNVRIKPRVSKQIAKNSDSKGLKNGGSKLKDLRSSISKQSGSGSELLVEMRPFRSTALEKGEVVEENATSLGAAQTPENQSKKLGALVTSQGLLDKLESSRKTLQTAQGLSATPRPRPERNVLMLANSFRRRSGTFPLKGQAKKRFTLLGINKRGASETSRIYMKHFRAQMKTDDVESMPKHMETGGSAHGLCVTSSETQDQKQSERNTHLASALDPPTARAASDCQISCTCTHCGQVATSTTELEVHVNSCHAGEVKLSCQTWDLPIASRRDLHEHLQSHQHQQTASVLSCQCCSFTSLSETNLRDHVKEKHGMGFLCPPCNLFFLSEKDVEEHRMTEKHIRLLVQPKTSQSFNNDSDLQTLPLSTLDSENIKEPLSESGGAAAEEVAPPRLSLGSEGRHVSRPQFQCKKCFYKTRSCSVLTRHIKLRHGQDYHFLCKACNLYSLSKEGMEKHIKRSKHLENAKKNNIGLSFEECIERVCIGANDRKEEVTISGKERTGGDGEGAHLQEGPSLGKSPTAQEQEQSGIIAKDEDLALTTTPKRGRPKGSVSRTCSHCGLLASSITNLTVHIRRKHSHQYSYLCKVCKYYTVTKGDMERHCATKKHRGRVEIEANGKRSSEIVVGPEGGNLEACSRSTSSDEHAIKSAEPDPSSLEKLGQEHGDPIEVEVENVLHPTNGEASSHLMDERKQVSLEPEDLVQQGEACSQRGAPGTGDNRCAHCAFSAYSSASLGLHVKRKHTKEFAFYCMACDYYAVTHREMTRHAATEKHKMKRQPRLSTADVGAGPSGSSRNIVIPEAQHQQSSEEFQVVSDQSPEALKPSNAAGGSVLDENTNLDMSKVLCVPDAIEVETEEESNLSEDPSFCETFQQPPAKDKVRTPEEMVTLNISSNGSPSKLQNGNSGSSALNYETAKNNHSRLSDIGDPDAHPESDGGSGGDHADEVLSKHGCPRVLGGAHSAESTVPVVMRMTGGQLHLDSCGQDQVGNTSSSADLKAMQEDPVLENKEILMDSQHETEIILEEDGLASDSTIESNDVYETIMNIDEKGQALYSFGRFDSSIVRIKNPEDGESIDQPEEGLMATEVRMSESPSKDCAQGLKKKKSEGSSFSESTRIRCDDCGFLADGLSGLNVHIAMKHPTKEKHFHCLLCGKSFYTESNLHQHLASAGHLRNEQASVEELPEGGATFKCVKCTEPFDSEQNLFLHIKGQHEELLREVNKHIVEDTEQINREREENQGNVCKYCGKLCRSSNSMAFLAHIRTHTGSKPFKCKICHFATAQLGDARNHVKRHLGMREYKCHVCGVAFVMKKHLNTHLLGKHGVGTPKERVFLGYPLL
ncbi:PREDICTED: zinc finger protein 407 [Miniopterus natalensis]|uniref:zinc finger protein 407 n=1 Tax=Miniopterus natalensis TaxID=291302 RepID=UPI0007A6A84C|nr:PREDICTED: zinc finger protein 407 [Miniopterus natalensis]